MPFSPLPLFARFLLLALLLGAAGARADAAANLAQRVYDRPNGRDLTTLGRMVLTEKDRAPRIREIVTYRLDKSGGETANLIRFIYPEDIAGTGLLSIDKADGDTDQWLYLPALDRVRRISSDRKGGRFVGSDLYFEDLQERKPSEDRHRLLGRQTENGILCEVLESVPIDTKDSVYSRRISWIDPATAIAQRVDYFEKDPTTPSKRWLLRGKKRNQGYWTLTDSRVIDLESGHETRMVVDAALYDQKLPAKLFTTQALADESLESEYRP
ncbi:MAG: outer membrane lipoprotein-sorting protein [Gammaproteobacteria bacterium]|nr:outer membrane lipoprotein-sorting protein [Gammaproteobacteria bacterium]MBU1407646.1 outer membrane lipoprotein-sorting protein [Gammaproteobacteria bacterium]MBU1531759.1 outer membrane lipoprotein-sorting protein [Gammaproteobacteria bacterium]